MTEQTVIFLSTVVVFVVCLTVAYTVYLRRARKVSGNDGIGPLLAQLRAVDRGKLAQVAGGLDDSSEFEDGALESWQVWSLIGGLDGMEALAANCDVLIDLACHVQAWYPEALTVAEELRLNAREIHWHLERLRAVEQHGRRSAYPEYAQRAVAIYLRMTRNVLDLYQTADMPGLPQLEAAL